MSDNQNKSASSEKAKNIPDSAAVLLGVDRPKPHDDKAEVAVLGAMLLSQDAAAIAMSQLNFEGAFYQQRHQIIFNAMLALNPKGEAGMDEVVLADHLHRTGQLENIGGISYIQELMDKVPTAAHIEHYVQIVKGNAVLRRIIATCSDAILKCYDAEGDVAQLLDLIEKQILEVSQLKQSNDYQAIEALIPDALNYIMELLSPDKSKLGIPTGYPVLDQAMTGGLQPGALFVLAARPAIGKTALALNMAANIALRNGGTTPVGVFSLEMSSLQLVMRLLSSQSKVNINRWAFTDDHPQGELQMVKETCEFLKNSHIYIDDTGGIDILELRSKARRMAERHGIKVLFIDYLQLISINSGRNSNRENDVARISGALKALAKELNIPIVVLAQVKRAAEQNGEPPKLSNLRESGAIEQDADVVALLHRSREEQFDQKEDAQKGLKAQLIIAKNRSGRTCKQHLVFFPQYTRFDPASDEVAEEDVPQE